MREHIPHSISHEKLKRLTPSMRFTGTSSYKEWQANAYDKLLELLGLPLEKCDPLFEVEFDRNGELYREIRFSFQSEEGYFAPCHLLIPNGAASPLPLMICLQGHSTGMHNSLGEARYEGDETSIAEKDKDTAIQAVRQGFCAVTLEQRCMGECGGTPKPDCYLNSLTNILIGRTTIGERVWDVQRLIDVICSEFSEFVDTDKIYCMGNSGGGTVTFYAACIEKRIAAAMPSCSVCTYEHSIAAIRHCTCNFIPGIRKYFEMGDLCGLIAPRKLVIVAGIEDSIFPIAGVEASYERARELFAAANAENNCALVKGAGGHRFYADDAWPVFKSLL